MASAIRSSLQARVWRWHFFAGLMVVPFAVILAVTGAIYLFHPQFDGMIERGINASGSTIGAQTSLLAADDLVERAVEAHPDAKLVRVVLPANASDNTLEVELQTAGGPRLLWMDQVSGDVLRDVPSGARFMAFLKRIHGTLLGGNWGSLVVETMACWLIIMVVTGVYIWWPRDRPWWRVFAPEFGAGGGRREVWRKVHGMTGSWIGALVLVMLLSGLPWTQVWGEGFTRAKAIAGLKSPGQEWFVTLQSSDPHAGHSGMGAGANLWDASGEDDVVGVTSAAHDMGAEPLSLQAIVDKVTPQHIAAPVEVQPPRGENGVWSVRGMAPNRFLQETIHYDRWSGDEVMRIGFGDHNVADQVVAVGVSFHEGALFGWVNQVIGVIAALGVVLMSVTGAIMWWRRRPTGRLGAPPLPADRRIAAAVIVVILGLCLFLPMAGLTLVAALGLERGYQLVVVRRAQE